jgi:hypothetical protein
VALRDRVEVQELGDLGRVDAVVLALAAVDQPQLAGVGDGHAVGQRRQAAVQVAVAAARLVRDGERPRHLGRDPLEQRRPVPAHLEPADRLPVAVQHAHRRAAGVHVQADVVHRVGRARRSTLRGRIRSHRKPPFGW